MGSVCVREIEMAGFMGYTKPVTMHLPTTGIVLVSGPNGAGKSSGLEAVATGLWGKTLRGASPWRTVGDGTFNPGHVRIACEGYEVTRKCGKSGKKVVSFTGGDYDTATKATAAMVHKVGAWEVWRRTCVFSAYDAAHFSEATDGERKRLIEVLVGADSFDRALPLCRDELKQTDGKFDRLRHAKEVLGDSTGTHRQALGAAKRILATLTRTAEPDARKYRELSSALEGATASWQASRDRLDKHARGSGARDATIQQLERQLQQLGSGDCPTCEQDVPDSTRARIRKDVEARKKISGEAENVARIERKRLEETAHTLRKRVDSLREEKGSERARLQEAKDTDEARKEAEKSVANATIALDQLEEKLDDTEAALDIVTREHGVLHAVEQVLGLKGVRAHVLGRALDGLTDMSNYWLARMVGPDMRVHFKPYSEKARGGVVDALAMEVEGVGGGQGYKATSGGERRRIDAAVLLALAQLAAGAHGNQGNTLFFDEVFDPLDDDGISGVAAALHEIAKTRPVLVVSHNPRLVERLEADVHYHIEDGRIDKAA